MINKPISYGRQYISDEDIQAVVDTLKSDYLTCGPAIPAFEKHLANMYIASMQLPSIMQLQLFTLQPLLWALNPVITLSVLP